MGCRTLLSLLGKRFCADSTANLGVTEAWRGRTIFGRGCPLSMGHSANTRREKRSERDAASLAKALAPEDVRAGEFVAVLEEVWEAPSFFWSDGGALMPREEVVRIRYTPTSEAVPLKVKGVCLPYVLVKQPCGAKRTLDVRKSRLARLDRRYARAAWKAYRKRARHAGPTRRGDDAC
jgi:hypothetical protein